MLGGKDPINRTCREMNTILQSRIRRERERGRDGERETERGRLGFRFQITPFFLRVIGVLEVV